MAGAAQEAEALSARYRLIQAEPRSSARRMRADTLLLDVSKAVEKQREQSCQLAEFEQTLAEARPVLDAGHAAIMAQAETALAREEVATALALQPRLRELIETHRLAEAASARRNAVLTALAEVGYEEIGRAHV